MITVPASSAHDLAWRERWIADIIRRQRAEMPASLWPESTQVEVAEPTTPIPEPPVSQTLPETGAIPSLRETAMIPSIKLLQPIVDVRDTRELISSAVLTFWQKHRCLPSVVGINPIRNLTITDAAFFALDQRCVALGCYTVGVISVPQLGCDTILLWGRRYDGWGEIGDSYL